MRSFIFPKDAVLERDNTTYASVCIVVHLHYEELFERHWNYIKKIPDFADVIITTSNDRLYDRVLNRGENRVRLIKKINRGRDVSSLLVTCREIILRYDFVCFLHDKGEKKNCLNNEYDEWDRCLWENTIGSEQYILNMCAFLENNTKIGCLTPPVILYGRLDYALKDNMGKNSGRVLDLARQLGLSLYGDFSTPDISIGTCFWARVDALRKLLEVEWRYEDFDDEPMPPDVTLSHAVERVLFYVVEDAGYEPGIVMTDQYAAEMIDYRNSLLKNMIKTFDEKVGVSSIAEYIDYKEQIGYLVNFVKKYKKVYIYGAGKYGVKCLKRLRSSGYVIEGFITTERTEKSRKEGLPVFCVDDIRFDESKGVVVAANKENTKEIELELRKRTSSDNVFFFTVTGF